MSHVLAGYDPIRIVNRNQDKPSWPSWSGLHDVLLTLEQVGPNGKPGGKLERVEGSDCGLELAPMK